MRIDFRPARDATDTFWDDVLGGGPWVVPATLIAVSRDWRLVLVAAVFVVILSPYGTYRLGRRLTGRI